MDNKRRSQKQEKRTAKQFGGNAVPGSGCFDNSKGDARTDKYLIENKFTTGTYTLKATTWDKIRKEALRDGLREPLMQIDFVISEMETRSYVIMDKGVYEEMFPEDASLIYGYVTIRSSFSFGYADIKKYVATFQTVDFCWIFKFPKFELAMIELDRFLEKERGD